MALTRVKGSPVLASDVIGVMSLVDFPSVVGDGVTDDTAAFQAVLDQAPGNILYIPNGASSYRIGTVNVPSDVTMVMEPGVTFLATATIGATDPMFRLDNTSNVTIHGNGALVTMGGQYTTGEQRHCIDAGGASDLYIDNLQLDGAGGDGIRLRQTFSAGLAFCDTVRILNCQMTENRRQGISITSAKNVWINDCQIRRTGKGPAGIAAPGFGIDIEPNFSTDEIQNININNLHTIDNGPPPQGGGITLTLSNFNNLGKFVTVYINNHYSEDDYIGFRVTPTENDTVPLAGEIVYNGGTIFRSGIYGIAVDGWSSLAPAIVLNRPKIMEANVTNSASSVFGAGLFVGRPSGGGGAATVGNVKIIEPDIFDQRATAQMTIAMMLKDFDSDALREVNVINPIRLGWLDPARNDNERIDFDGTGTFVDGFDRARYSLDASFTMTPEVYTPVFDNSLFTNLRNVTLSDTFQSRSPEIQFETVQNQTLRITAGPTSTIEPGVGQGGFIQSRRAGSVLRLRRFGATWRVMQESGAWFRQGEGTEADSFVHTGTINPTLLTNIVIFPGGSLQGTDSIRFLIAGTKGGAADGAFIQPFFSGTQLFSFGIDQAGTDWALEGEIVRIGSSVRYVLRFQVTPTTGLPLGADMAVVQSGTLAADMDLDQDLSITGVLVNAADSLTRLIWHREIRINQPE